MSLKLSVQVLSLLTLSACGAGAPEELDGQFRGEGALPSTANKVESLLSNANGVTACKYFVGKGLKDYQAAGIVGNLMQESNVSPTAVEYGGGPGRGTAQWSVGGRWDTDASDNVVWYANQQHQDKWSLQLQLDFTWYELMHFSRYGLAALRSSTNITDATIAFEDDFEQCGHCDEAQRIAYAKDALSSCTLSPGGGGSHGCPSGDVCIYPEGAGWNGDHPESAGFYHNYGYYNLSGQTDTHRIFNNQTGGATVKLCTNYGGTGCGSPLAAGHSEDVNLTPINSITLEP